MNSKVVAVVAGLLAVIGLLAARGCDRYGTVSPKTYQFAKAVFSACQRRDDPRMPRAAALAKIRAAVNTSAANGEISGRERDILHELLLTAESGKPQDAAHRARQLMEEQLRTAPQSD